MPAEERAFGKLLALLENSPKCEEVPSDVVAELPVACPIQQTVVKHFQFESGTKIFLKTKMLENELIC